MASSLISSTRASLGVALLALVAGSAADARVPKHVRRSHGKRGFKVSLPTIVGKRMRFTTEGAGVSSGAWQQTLAKLLPGEKTARMGFVEWEPSAWGSLGRFNRLALRASDKTRMALARYKRFVSADGKRTALFDITVSPRFRRRGLYALMLRHAIARVGGKDKIDNIPIALYRGYDNWRVFRDNVPRRRLLGRQVRVRLRRLKAMSRDERRDFRRQLIAAALAMPAAKVRDKVGFGRVARIRYNPSKCAAIVDFEKGSASQSDAARIFVSSHRSVYEIGKRGAITTARNAADYLVEGYDYGLYRRETYLP